MKRNFIYPTPKKTIGIMNYVPIGIVNVNREMVLPAGISTLLTKCSQLELA